MTYFDHSYTVKRSLFDRIAGIFDTPFDRRTRALSAQVAELRALSDEELSRRGIARQDIVFHVFSKGGQ